MIDIHTHIIPNIDDGATSVDETINLIKEAEEAGFTDIILTPHYITNYYDTPGCEVHFWKESLQKVLDEKNININLHSGMEIYIAEDIDKLLTSGTIISLANSKYLLLELPMNNILKKIDDILFVLQSMGYKIIIAHPERYKAVQENINYAIQLKEKGCLLQSNYGSIVGLYGKNAKKTFKKLIKLNLISFLGTDTHKQKTIYKFMPQILKKLKKIISKEELHILTTENPQLILNKK